MIRYLVFLGTVGATWVVHVALVTVYMRFFADTHRLPFRVIYALELSLTFCIAMTVYLARVASPVSLGVMLLTVVGFLAVVDTTLSLSIKSIRSSLDVWHFAVAYSILALSLAILYKLRGSA